MQNRHRYSNIMPIFMVIICSLIIAVSVWIMPAGHLGNFHQYSIFRHVSVSFSHNWQPCKIIRNERKWVKFHTLLVVFLALSGKSCGIWSPGHRTCVCVSLTRFVHSSSDISKTGLTVDWLIGVECTSFKGALERFALCLNSLKKLAAHIKLMRESKIMTLSNNEKCNTNYNECRERCLHFLGTLSCIEKFLRIN